MHGYPRGFQRAIALVFTLLAVTGLALVPGLLFVRLGMENVAWHATGDTRTWLTGAHVFTGYAWMAMLGALWSRHMRNGWRVPHRRLSGTLQGFAALALVLSALVILYAGEDRTALVAALAHVAAAVLAAAVIVQHVVTAKSGVAERRSGMDRRY